MNVKPRDYSESQFIYNNKQDIIKNLSKDLLTDMYIVKRMSKKDIAKEHNCDPCVIDRLLKKYNIAVRNNGQSKIGILAGSKHPNWKGGKTSLDKLLREYFNINIAPQARKRDGYRCKICGSKKDLHVHHIIEFNKIIDSIISEHKKANIEENIDDLYNIIVNDSRFTDLNNLITLCKECHFYKVHGYKKTIRSEASKEERSTTIPQGSTP